MIDRILNTIKYRIKWHVPSLKGDHLVQAKITKTNTGLLQGDRGRLTEVAT